MKRIILASLVLFIVTPALAFTFRNKVSVFPDGATKDSIVEIVEGCGLTDGSVPMSFHHVKTYATILDITGVQAARLLCAQKKFDRLNWTSSYDPEYQNIERVEVSP